MFHGMTAPVIIIDVLKAHGSVQCLADGIVLIYQESDTWQVQTIGPFLGRQQQLSGYAQTTIIGKYGQGIKIEFTCLSFVVHTRMILAYLFFGSLYKGAAQFMQTGTVIAYGDTDNLIRFHCHQRIPITIL